MDDITLIRRQALEAFAIGYDLGVQVAKDFYAKKGGDNEN